MMFLRYQEEWCEHTLALLQVLVSVPMLKDFCLELSSSHHLRLGPIGLALRELVQTVYGELTGSCLSHTQLICIRVRTRLFWHQLLILRLEGQLLHCIIT